MKNIVKLDLTSGNWELSSIINWLKNRGDTVYYLYSNELEHWYKPLYPWPLDDNDAYNKKLDFLLNNIKDINNKEKVYLFLWDISMWMCNTNLNIKKLIDSIDVDLTIFIKANSYHNKELFWNINTSFYSTVGVKNFLNNI